jgi:hypothetical protein
VEIDGSVGAVSLAVGARPSGRCPTREERFEELPERVRDALRALAGAAKERLLALSVAVGLGVLGELLEAEVDEVVGPRGRHDFDRVALRHGQKAGEVTLGRRRVAVERPRVLRSADGSEEVALETYRHFAARDAAVDVDDEDGGSPFGRSVLTTRRKTISSRRGEPGVVVEAARRQPGGAKVSRPNARGHRGGSCSRRCRRSRRQGCRVRQAGSLPSGEMPRREIDHPDRDDRRGPVAL